jgi:putative addiction module component (TIGR02574 family)
LHPLINGRLLNASIVGTISTGGWTMPPQVEELYREALRLGERERGDLAAKLIESLDPATDEQVEAAWSAEIRQRIEELDSGTVQSIPWPEARRLIREDS